MMSTHIMFVFQEERYKIKVELKSALFRADYRISTPQTENSFLFHRQ